MYCLQTAFNPHDAPARTSGDSGRVGSSSSPAILVARILAGDSAAEGELATRYYRTVHVALRQMLRGRVEADDLAQETFSLALVKLRAGQLRQPSQLPSFLLSLARNLAINLFRINTRRATDANSEVVEERSVATPDPLGGLIATEKADLVRRLLAELEISRDREVLFRFYIAEEDKHAICEDLELSSLHFNRVLHRARRRYKQLYEARVESADDSGG